MKKGILIDSSLCEECQKNFKIIFYNFTSLKSGEVNFHL